MHTHNFCRVVVLSFLQVIPCRPCRGILLDALVSSQFSTPFLALALRPTILRSLPHPSSPSTATPQGGFCFGRLAEQSPLTDYEHKSSTCLQQDSLDTNLDDLATTVDGSEMLDTADVRRSISPLFSQEREAKQMLSIQCFKFLSGETHADTDLFSSVGRPVRGVESFSNVEKPFSKGERNRELVQEDGTPSRKSVV